MKRSEAQFLAWLAVRQPKVFRIVSANLANKSGMSGLGDTSSDTSILGDITGALQDAVSTVSTAANDKALISYNLQRAQQGLAPVTSLPATAAPVPMLGSL